MTAELAGYRTIVTGGARGIGAAIARGFVESGAQVAVLDTRDDLAEALVAALPPRMARFWHCDVSNSAQVADAFDQSAKWMSGLDTLVHCAGLDKPGYTPEDLPEDVFDLVLAVNAKGTYLANQAAFRLMKGTGGAIVNMGSLAGIRGMADRPAYSAAKGAVLAWTRAVAAAWGPHDVTVNAIAPTVATEVAERYLAQLDPEERRALEENRRRVSPLGGRLGNVERDLLPLVRLLAGPGGRYMTGQTFAVDGGRTMLGS
jgi:NAD(P)-dependent dehydrogenase (short-subunit alcohol dehydrogenase family)